MEADASSDSVDRAGRTSDDEFQSSDEQEPQYGNHADEAVRTGRKTPGPGRRITQPVSSYTVICTVGMVLAVPRGYEDAAESERHPKNQVKSKCILEAPKAQAYYHVEYNLLPGDSEPIRVDLVMFGSMAKVYMDKKTKILKPWQEGEHLWLSWSQSVKLKVTRELLIKMSTHKITFKLWDTKDKVSSKAKYDRPKSFRRKMEEPEQNGGIKGMVYMLQALYEKRNPSTRYSKESSTAERQPPSKLKCNSDDLPAVEVSGVSDKEHRATFSSYGRKPNYQSGPKLIPFDAPADQVSTRSGTLRDDNMASSREKHTHKSVQERTAEEDVRVNGAASAELRAAHFLAGETSLTECLTSRCDRPLKGLCSISLDQPLVSEGLKAELNPLIISISSASSMPSTPVSFSELEHKCMPVYCQYKFNNMPAYRTKGQSHGANIHFNDVNVILAGLLSTEELLECLRGPPLEIEIHDRDRKAQGLASIPAIFGTEPSDDKLASTALVSIKGTVYSPNKDTRNACDPYGVAKLNLSDLIGGQRCLRLSLPITGFGPVQSLGTQRNKWGGSDRDPAGAPDAQDNALANGHYLRANSELEVLVELAQPFPPEPATSGGRCPFGRVVYVLQRHDLAFLEQLRSEVLRINAAAFQSHGRNGELDRGGVKNKLQGLLMDATEREDRHLNAVTGFHVVDEDLHLLVLEGLKDKAIRTLWEAAPMKLPEDAETRVGVLYNSGLSFSKRLYHTLDVGLSPLYLHKPLRIIMRQPLVYIRDTVPPTCLQAMLRINHLCGASSLEEVVQSNLFPTAEMVQSLKSEFGSVSSAAAETSTRLRPASPRKTSAPVADPAWERTRTDHGVRGKNFIRANIKDIRTAAGDLQTPAPAVFVAKPDEGQTAHNYSIQTINSTSLAKKLLLQEMAKTPGRRFTYSQGYHSFTADAVDAAAERKAAEARSRAAWQTRNGFVVQNLKDATESNKHPMRPDEARVEALRKPWKENVLHENILKPVLNGNRWPWSKRQKDFELYRKAPAVSCPAPPVTIHLAGDALRQEQRDAAHAQYARWLRKILPDRESCGRARVAEFKSHVRTTGLDKLHDLLKDKPMKLSLRAWGEGRRGKGEKPERARSPDTQGDQSEHASCQFGRYWRPRSFQHKRRSLPLTDEEKSLHVFQAPRVANRTYTDFANTRHTGNVVHTRTYDGVALHIRQKVIGCRSSALPYIRR